MPENQIFLRFLTQYSAEKPGPSTTLQLSITPDLYPVASYHQEIKISTLRQLPTPGFFVDTRGPDL